MFARRNTNRSQMQAMALWPKVIARAKEQGATEVGISTNASFGTNFLGAFPVEAVMKFFDKRRGSRSPRSVSATRWAGAIPSKSRQSLAAMTWSVPLLPQFQSASCVHNSSTFTTSGKVASRNGPLN